MNVKLGRSLAATTVAMGLVSIEQRNGDLVTRIDLEGADFESGLRSRRLGS